jgi:hypothetical protein
MALYFEVTLPPFGVTTLKGTNRKLQPESLQNNGFKHNISDSALTQEGTPSLTDRNINTKFPILKQKSKYPL